MSHRQNHRF